MQLNKLTHKNYMKFGNVFQLKIPLDIEVLIPEDDSAGLLGQIIEEMDLHEIYQSYSRLRKNQPTPRQLLKILVYAYIHLAV
jgi:transposase